MNNVKFDKVDKSILYRMDFDRYREVDFNKNAGNFIGKFEQKVLTTYVQEMDEIMFKLLYEEYEQNSDCDTLIVLDKSEFKKFIQKYLPIYLKESE